MTDKDRIPAGNDPQEQQEQKWERAGEFNIYLRMVCGMYMVYLAWTMYAGRAEIPDKHRFIVVAFAVFFAAAGAFLLVNGVRTIIALQKEKKEALSREEAEAAETALTAEPEEEREEEDTAKTDYKEKYDG